jgi:transcriptional regulator with GAF, ATPase, and Fis domain
MIEEALRKSGGKIYGSDGAAELLGLRPTTLNSKIAALGIKRR